ncbi:Arginine biosynthesis protein ArgJ [Beggiatoa sp. PS]|nr:Arginine biosynthesis protein ArgJ [Beggiatoa sp. PS]
MGRAGVENLDIQAVKIYLGDVCIVEKGGVAESYTEEQGQRIMSEAEIRIRVLLGRIKNDDENGYSTRIWTSDLSHDYVRINAEYRT